MKEFRGKSRGRRRVLIVRMDPLEKAVIGAAGMELWDSRSSAGIN
jgi:hypothetical protein